MVAQVHLPFGIYVFGRCNESCSKQHVVDTSLDLGAPGSATESDSADGRMDKSRSLPGSHSGRTGSRLLHTPCMALARTEPPVFHIKCGLDKWLEQWVSDYLHIVAKLCAHMGRVPQAGRVGGIRELHTVMFGRCFIGVYRAPKGTTLLVASSLLFGQTFHDSLIASASSNCWKASAILAALATSHKEST